MTESENSPMRRLRRSAPNTEYVSVKRRASGQCAAHRTPNSGPWPWLTRGAMRPHRGMCGRPATSRGNGLPASSRRGILRLVPARRGRGSAGLRALDVARGKCQARAWRQNAALTDPNRPGPGVLAVDQLSTAASSQTAIKENAMSVYRVTEIIGTSSTSWEEAAAEAIRTASRTIRDLRVAEVIKQDINLDEAGAITYRTKLQLSFKYESEH